MQIPKINIKKTIILHPFLFAVFPILSLYSHNIGQVPFHHILMPSTVVLGAMLFLLLIFKLITKNNEKAAVLTSMFLILFSSYGHLYNAISSYRGGIDPLNFATHLSPIFTCIAILISAIYLIIKKCKNPNNLTNIFNLIAFFLVVGPIINIGNYGSEIINSPKNLDVQVVETKDIDSYVENTEGLPDIYYIILDKYSRADVLEEIFDFDNSAFINYLSNKNFYVATQSKANYHLTPLSLASSLNMEYINYLAEEAGEDSDNWHPLYEMIKNNKVMQFLETKGYTSIHFETGWYPTAKNPYADINIEFKSLTEFSRMLYENTILAPIGNRFDFLNYRVEQYKRILYEFDELAKIPDIKEPTFVFAHIIVPHDPYVFDKNGNFVSAIEEQRKGKKISYIEQLKFVNKKTEELINAILSKSEIPPIIILQSDEGTYPKKFRQELGAFDWNKATDLEFKQKMSILNAYYLPNADKNILKPDMTPVNNFRMLFNLYFGTDFELLPNKQYIFVNEKQIYKFLDFTYECREIK